MRGKHVVFKGIRKDIPNLEPDEFFFEENFQDGKLLRKLASGNILVATADGIQELEPKQVVVTNKTADWFNQESDRVWRDGCSFDLGMLPDDGGAFDIHMSLDPEFAIFGYCG